jgi:hypothetical protein
MAPENPHEPGPITNDKNNLPISRSREPTYIRCCTG